MLKLSAKFFEVTNLLVAEYFCTDSSARMSVSGQQTPDSDSIGQQIPEVTCQQSSEVTCQQTPKATFQQTHEATSQQISEATCQQTPEATCQQKSEATCQQTHEATCQKTPTGATQGVPTGAKSLKRKATNFQSPSPCIKLPRTVYDDDVSFYYNINKFRRTNIPKLDKLVTILQCQGYRASRTHFDHSAVRTSATVEQFLKALS